MLDFDLAPLYGTQTCALKQAVKRNKDRFPKDFMFQLTKKEWKELITNCDKLPKEIRFSPALPYAFTEHGVTMLASVLKTKKATKMNLFVVSAFISLRRFALNYKKLAEQIKELKGTSGIHSAQLNKIYTASDY